MSGYYEESAFNLVLECVQRLNRGERIQICASTLRQRGGILGAFLDNGVTPADHILERIVGSSYELMYRYTKGCMYIEFFRLFDELPDGVRSYVSVDRRHHYIFRERDCLYVPRNRYLSLPEEAQVWCALKGHDWVKGPSRHVAIPFCSESVPSFKGRVIDGTVAVERRIVNVCRSCHKEKEL